MKKNQKGFTIIEVVLVLAIAGLIFLMVFIALPALQRSQRNTQRKNDLSRFMTAVTQYQANNKGRTPFEPISENNTDAGQKRINDFIKRYIDGSCTNTTRYDRFHRPTSCGSQFTDPDGETYGFDARTDHTTYTQGDESQTPNSQVYFFSYENNTKTNLGTNPGKITHYIVVFTHSKCGATEGSVEWTTGTHDISMYYPLEGGQLVCADNQ